MDQAYKKNCDYIWFHLNSFPSGHVKIENENFNQEIILYAGEICKQHSKYKNLKDVKICYCKYGNVLKGEKIVGDGNSSTWKLLLSDVDGLYDKNPKKNRHAKKINEIFKINKTIEKMANSQTSTLGSGGMTTKISAAKICMNNGCDTIITNSHQGNPLSSVSKNNYSIFYAKKYHSSSRKKLSLLHISETTRHLSI